MTDDRDRFDRQLSDRLLTAEQRVGNDWTPPDPAGASRPGLVLRSTLVIGTTVVAVVIAVALLTRLPDRSPGDSSPSPSDGVNASARDGDFTLTLSSPRSAWTTADDIQIAATLSYAGSEEQVDIYGGGGPVVFSLRQIEGGTAELPGGQEVPCLPYALTPTSPLIWPFAKFGSPDAAAPFDHAFFDDPELHLPAGGWEVRALLDYHIRACLPPSAEPLRLEVAIELEVIEAGETARPTAVEPTATPEPTTTPMPTVAARNGWTVTDLSDVVGQTDPAYPEASISSISEARGVLFATGRETKTLPGIWWSTDGSQWRLAKLPTSPEPYGFSVIEVIDAGPRFVAIAAGGLAEGSGIFANAIYVSEDGRRWRNADSIPSIDGGAHTALARVGDRLVAAGASVWVSEDGGLTWLETVSADEFGGYATELTVPGNLIFAAGTKVGGDLVGAPSYAWGSSDLGDTWRRHTIDDDEIVTALEVLPDGRLVAGNGQAVWTSGDLGRTWARSPLLGCCSLDLTSTPTGLVAALTYPEEDPTRFVSSTDGVAWTEIEGAPLAVKGLAWGPRFGLVAVGKDAVAFGPNPLP
jgi:hypothetical protein